MKVDTSNCLVEPLVAGLDPERLQRYVQATGWKLEPRLGKGRLAVFERPESRLAQIRIPLTHELLDFAVLLSEAVAILAAWEKRPALDLLYELLLPPADRLCFRESGPAVGSIDVPLDHGLELLAGVRKLLLAAACSVLRPEPWHPRLNLPEAKQFLDSCRLAYPTGVGFAVTVACPVEPASGAASQADATPFARRVTTLLMRSLQRLARAFAVGDASSALAVVDGEPTLSANLCEALLDMTPQGDGAALTVTAEPARTLPVVGVTLLSSVRLQREDFTHLASLVRQLRLIVTARVRTGD